MFTKSVIVLCFWSLVSIGCESKCICNHTDAGTHCGQKPDMDDCHRDNIYQCNGINGSQAHHYGPCAHGCVQDGHAHDYCPLEVGDCICLNKCDGKHCGQSILMGESCWRNHIYQCNGQYGSVAHHFGACDQGCAINGCSLDYCREDIVIV